MRTLTDVPAGFFGLVEGQPTILRESLQPGLGPEQGQINARIGTPGDGVDGIGLLISGSQTG
ncbi:hypothetical protein D3C80_1865840 [compost metagenome]